MKRRLSVVAAVVSFALASGVVGAISLVNERHFQAATVSTASAAHAPAAITAPINDEARTETVCVVGGSMAYGWKDPHNDSYLRRAFAIRSHETTTNYRYISHAIPGFTADHLNAVDPGAYQRWLLEDKPQVVVLSWGLENDMSSHYRDSIPAFQDAIHNEITEALNAHAAVLVVTPPVTELLATTDHRKVTGFIHAEFQSADSFHNPNVTTINVYGQMNHFLSSHHRTVKPYIGNRWHPNGAGHRLAGDLLAHDLNKRFGNGPILYKGETPTQPSAGASASI